MRNIHQKRKSLDKILISIVEKKMSFLENFKERFSGNRKRGNLRALCELYVIYLKKIPMFKE